MLISTLAVVLISMSVMFIYYSLALINVAIPVRAGNLFLGAMLYAALFFLVATNGAGLLAIALCSWYGFIGILALIGCGATLATKPKVVKYSIISSNMSAAVIILNLLTILFVGVCWL